jgi:hypothetical protein
VILNWSTHIQTYLTLVNTCANFSSGLEFGKKLSTATISPDTLSSVSLVLAYRLYISCRACHKQCNRFVTKPRWQPSRILDVGVEGDTEWKLRICSERGYSSPNHLTLSYCWGSSQSLLLTSSKVEAFGRGHPICEIPRTFRDAVLVACRLSILNSVSLDLFMYYTRLQWRLAIRAVDDAGCLYIRLAILQPRLLLIPKVDFSGHDITPWNRRLAQCTRQVLSSFGEIVNEEVVFRGPQ